MKKQAYMTPTMRVIKIQPSSMFCTSNQPNRHVKKLGSSSSEGFELSSDGFDNEVKDR
jgi:hypothetical protein